MKIQMMHYYVFSLKAEKKFWHYAGGEEREKGVHNSMHMASKNSDFKQLARVYPGIGR